MSQCDAQLYTVANEHTRLEGSIFYCILEAGHEGPHEAAVRFNSANRYSLAEFVATR